ncbi:SCO family protein [Sphingomonas glacialis]|uniref:SCO family protein n=1 Tax=Sphingomonas glacialis TaxID=658225 RepID=A0A502FTK1_9SPHN|nr:SCO family protein [Sphingomonas glacialis]TPG52719.1 SCO family protein [Sphingomonas glacialis]
MAGGAMNQIARTLGALLLTVSAAGCSGSAPPTRAPLDGVRIGGPFRLIDQDGKPRTDRDFAGRYRIMYFGYTFCPDVCPTDLQTIGAGLRLFEAQDAKRAAEVVPIFVTVDPKRDTSTVLKAYTAAFHPRMIGLTGSPEAIAAAAKAYGVTADVEKPNAEGGYLVAHSRFAILMDPAGKPVVLLPADKTPRDVAAELERWVK